MFRGKFSRLNQNHVQLANKRVFQIKKQWLTLFINRNRKRMIPPWSLGTFRNFFLCRQELYAPDKLVATITNTTTILRWHKMLRYNLLKHSINNSMGEMSEMLIDAMRELARDYLVQVSLFSSRTWLERFWNLFSDQKQDQSRKVRRLRECEETRKGLRTSWRQC